MPIEGVKVPIETAKEPIEVDKVPIENEQYIKIIEYLILNENITNAIAVGLLKIKPTRAKVILREMVEQNLLEAKGKNRFRHYVLKTSPSNIIRTAKK